VTLDLVCYQIVVQTVSHHILHPQKSSEEAGLTRRNLQPREKDELIKYIQKLAEAHLQPTRETIQNYASHIAKKRVSISWVDHFVQRHANELTPQWSTSMDCQLHAADSSAKYTRYFELLKEKIEYYKVEPEHTYNMDEKGFMLVVVGRSKRSFSRASYGGQKVRSTVQDGSREWISLIACVCADGSHLDPDVHQAYISSSPSGWTNNEIGLAWLKQVFDRSTKAKARSSYRLLILDGHGSHLTMDFIDYCDQNRILLTVYPPHSTHTLQPLDVAPFKPLSTAYSNEISSFMAQGQGLVSMSKTDFFQLFYRAWKASFKQSTILRSFEATGLSPFNPHRTSTFLGQRKVDIY
jgi:hypothetical protein